MIDDADDFLREPDDSDLPARIGPYVVLGRLGTGSQSVVYLCADERPEVSRRFAVKVVFDDNLRFGQELRSLSQLESEFVASLHHTGRTASGMRYLAMEYVDGKSVTEFAKAGNLSLEERLQLFIDLCAGVADLHAAKVVHRDLKPAHFLVRLVDGRPTPKIIDLGMSRMTGAAQETRQTVSGEIVGTPAYMSPEQALGVTETDTRADVYSLGVILYELISGQLPIPLAGRSLGEALRAVEASPPDPLPRLQPRSLHRKLQAIVDRAMHRNPASRYDSVTELQTDVRHALADEPITAEVAGPAARTFAWLRRHQRIAAVAGLVLLLGLAALIYSERARRDALANGKRMTELAATAIATFSSLSRVLSHEALDDALDSLTHAIAGWRGIPASDVPPELTIDDDRQLELYCDYVELRGSHAWRTGNRDTELHCRQVSMRMRAELHRRDPTDTDRLARLSLATVRLGDCHKHTTPEQAKTLYERALAYDEEAAAASPELRRQPHLELSTRR